MPPPQQFYASPAVSSIISKWLNPTFLVLLVFLIVALPLSTPSASGTHQQQSPSHPTPHNQSFPSNNKQSTSFAEAKKQWPHWSATLELEELCPSAKIWATHPGSFCVTLWNSPYLSNRTELEAREGRAIKHFCEMDRILERFDCAQEYSVNVMRGQCKLCRDAYREWACAMVTDTLDDGRLDCETKLMPCPSCASICHQVMRLCPYLTPDRNQAGPDGKITPQVSQYGGHPAFYCPLENDDPSDPAYTSHFCFHHSPFSSDPDYVHNICTNPPIHYHHNPYAEESKHYFNHRSRTNNVRHSYFSQSSTDKRFSGSSSSKSKPSPGSPSTSNKGRREDYLNSNEKISSNNNNNYYDSESITNRNNFNNKFDYNDEESFIPYDDHEYGGDDEDNRSEPEPHYTSCCWTYASSVVTFTNSKAYPEYGSDSYFSSDKTTTSSSSINSTVLTNSGSGSSSSSAPATTIANRKPSSESDNRVILNCCDSPAGKCTSKDDEEDASSSSEDIPPLPYASSDSAEILEPSTQPTHHKLKSSRKRSSENIGNTHTSHSRSHHSSNHEETPLVNEIGAGDNDATVMGSPRDVPDLKEELHPVVRFVKDLPKQVVVAPKLKSGHDHADHDIEDVSSNSDRQQLHDSLPQPTHIPPGLDYDEHYMDTEPDGDGGSSSTELEDEDVFEPSFSRADWEKTQTHRDGSRHPDYSAIWSRDTTFSSNHKKPEEIHRRPRTHDSNTNNLMKSTTTSTTINNLRNNFKHNNNKNNNVKKESSSSLSSEGSSVSVISGGGGKGSSSSVHYQKNAFMAIVIGGDGVDRRHLNLRTATDIIGGRDVNVGVHGGLVTDSETDEFQVNDFESKFSSSDIHFNSMDFSNDYENDPNTDEIYFRRTRGNLDSDKEARSHNNENQQQFKMLDEPVAQTTTDAASASTASARLLASSSIIGIASSTLKKLKGSLFLVFFSPSLDFTFSIPSLQSSKTTLQFPQYYSASSTKASKSRTSRPLHQQNSFEVSYFLFTFLLLLILVTTNNFLPIPLLSTDNDPSDNEAMDTRYTTYSGQMIMKKRRRSVTLLHSSANSTFTPNKSQSVMMNVADSGLRKCNEKDKKIDKAAEGGVMNAEDNQDYKNYYDDIRNSPKNNLEAYAVNYNNYNNCTDDSHNLCKCKYDLLHVDEYNGAFSGIYKKDRTASILGSAEGPKGKRLYKKVIKTPPEVHLPRLGTDIKSERNDKGGSCSHQLALLYYKVIKFLLILKSRSSDHDTITILSVQHNKNNLTVIILGYFLKLVTFTIKLTCIVADDLTADLQSLKSWKGRARGRRRVEEVRVYNYIKFKNEKLFVIKITIRTITRLDYYYYKDLEEDSNDNIGIKLCCSSNYNYFEEDLVLVILSTILELDFQALCSSCTTASTFGILRVPNSEGCGKDTNGRGLSNSGHSGDSHSRFKLNDKSTPPTDSLELIKLKQCRLRILNYSRLSDSWVTTNCTISSNTIAYSYLYKSKGRRYGYYYYYEYSNRINRRVTIINKIIQFVVQYNLNGSCSCSSRQRTTKKCLGQFKTFKIFKMYSHCSRERSEKYGLEESGEFPTKSYSKFLAFRLINLKISVIYDINPDYDYYWYNENIRWLQIKPPSPYKLQLIRINPLFLMCYCAIQQPTNCQQYHHQKCQQCKNSDILTICQGYCINLLTKLSLRIQPLFRSKLLRDYDSVILTSLTYDFLCNSCPSYKITEINLCYNYYDCYCYYYANSSSQKARPGLRLGVKAESEEAAWNGGHFHGQSICFPYSVLNVNCSILCNLLRWIDNNYENYIIVRVCKHCKRRSWWSRLTIRMRWNCYSFLSGSESQCLRNCNSWTAKDSNATINTKALTVRTVESVQCFLLLLFLNCMQTTYCYLESLHFLAISNIFSRLNYVKNVFNTLNTLNLLFLLLLLKDEIERCKLQKLFVST